MVLLSVSAAGLPPLGTIAMWALLGLANPALDLWPGLLRCLRVQLGLVLAIAACLTGVWIALATLALTEPAERALVAWAGLAAVCLWSAIPPITGAVLVLGDRTAQARAMPAAKPGVRRRRG